MRSNLTYSDVGGEGVELDNDLCDLVYILSDLANLTFGSMLTENDPELR